MANPTMSTPAALEAVVKPTLGAILLGLVFTSTFFGVTLLQTYQYYDRYWHDTIWLKLFVAVIGILDTVQVVTVIHSNWWYLIENYANTSALAIVPWSLGVEVGITTSIGLLVQSFFALRVYILSRGNKPITATILTLTIAQFILGVYYAVKGQETRLVVTIATITWASTASLACSIAGDFLITATMCFYLTASRSGIKRSDKLIDVLIAYTVNTGLLTTICAVCTIILSEVVPDSYWDTMFYFMISKCYVNSTLATLNARDKLRTTVMHGTAQQPVPLSPFRPSGQKILADDSDMQFASNPMLAKTEYSEGTTTTLASVV
ncbi:hypothetical protein WOLCODRAFT_134876 [Wolfiporia cocos MD-104 SS10]|uniref:DUF6534 domain-containing protein n=1 Tax=Wolfiporia cocos (strain MD-104) TaxID=742152 RepID=A0A2H3J600_WOLCO|nr:hypothetical protein WOLCODRAFT_134876 [Wolfiporia cocos MD-104 SS10]